MTQKTRHEQHIVPKSSPIANFFQKKNELKMKMRKIPCFFQKSKCKFLFFSPSIRKNFKKKKKKHGKTKIIKKTLSFTQNKQLKKQQKNPQHEKKEQKHGETKNLSPPPSQSKKSKKKKSTTKSKNTKRKKIKSKYCSNKNKKKKKEKFFYVFLFLLPLFFVFFFCNFCDVFGFWSTKSFVSREKPFVSRKKFFVSRKKWHLSPTRRV